MKFYFNPPVFEVDGIMYDVSPLPYDKTKLEEGECYSFDNKVLIYRGRAKFGNGERLTGFYLTEDDDIYIHLPDEEKDKYDINKIKEFDVSSIIEEIINDNDSFTNPDDLEVIQNNSNITVPVIRDNDDFLTKIVKQVIIDKKINLKNYEHKVEKSLFTNMKGSLNTEKRKMSVLYFKRWSEVLGFDYKIVVTDSGEDRVSPLSENIIYDSTEDEYFEDAE